MPDYSYRFVSETNKTDTFDRTIDDDQTTDNQTSNTYLTLILGNDDRRNENREKRHDVKVQAPRCAGQHCHFAARGFVCFWQCCVVWERLYVGRLQWIR